MRVGGVSGTFRSQKSFYSTVYMHIGFDRANRVETCDVVSRIVTPAVVGRSGAAINDTVKLKNSAAASDVMRRSTGIISRIELQHQLLVGAQPEVTPISSRSIRPRQS